MNLEGQRTCWHLELGEQCGKAADALEIELEQLELNLGERPIDGLDISLGCVSS